MDYCKDRDFEIFVGLMEEGIIKGRREYGEAGFVKNNIFLMMEEELRDLAVYAFLGFQKLRLIREAFIKDAKGENNETSATS